MINVATKKGVLLHSGDQKTELCRDIPYYVATLIQANGSRELSQHRELKREERMSRQNKIMSQQRMAE